MQACCRILLLRRGGLRSYTYSRIRSSWDLVGTSVRAFRQRSDDDRNVSGQVYWAKLVDAVCEIGAEQRITLLQPVWEYRTSDASERSIPVGEFDGCDSDVPDHVESEVDCTGWSELTASSRRLIWRTTMTTMLVHLRNREVTKVQKESVAFVSFANAFPRCSCAPVSRANHSIQYGFTKWRQYPGIDPDRKFVEGAAPGAIYKNLLILGSRVYNSMRPRLVISVH